MFSVDIDRNIFSITTMGVSHEKIGEEDMDIKTEPFHLLFQVHVLHLAVTGFLYTKKKSNELVEIFKSI